MVAVTENFKIKFAIRFASPHLQSSSVKRKSSIGRVLAFQQGATGFTLVEVIIAFSIGLFIFLVGFALINGASTTRSQSLAQLRAAEDARLLFQMIERDLAGAYNAGQFKSSCLFGQSNSPNPNYWLQFCTKVDASNEMTNQYVLVQYYVVPNVRPAVTDSQGNVISGENVLCRQVTTSSSSSSSASSLPMPTTIASQSNPNYALIDNINRFYVIGLQWDPTSNSLTQAIGKPTHLQITLSLQYYNNVMQYDLNTGSFNTTPTFSKVIALPSTFQ